MKAIKMLCALAVITATMAIASCNTKQPQAAGVPDNAEIEKLIDKSERTAGDYSRMLNYLEAYVNELAPIYEQSAAAAKIGDDDKLIELDVDAINLRDQKYRKSSMTFSILSRISKEKMGQENYNRFQQIRNRVIELENLIN